MFKAARPVGNDAVALLSMLRSVQFTCLFLATKLCDQVHAIGLLRCVASLLSLTLGLVNNSKERYQTTTNDGIMGNSSS